MVNTTDVCYRNYSLVSKNGSLDSERTLESLAMAKHGLDSIHILYVTKRLEGYTPFNSQISAEVPMALFAHLQDTETNRVPFAIATKFKDGVFLEVLDSAFPDWAVKKMVEAKDSPYKLAY